MLKYLEIELPFTGFYNSVYDSEIDSQQEQDAEYYATHSDCEGGEQSFPEPLQISESDVSQMLFDCADYSAAHREIAQAYVDSFSYLAAEALGISAPITRKIYDWQSKKYKTRRAIETTLRLEFAAMESPREYNFTTDRIFAKFPVSVVQRLWAICKEDGFTTLGKIADARHTSRSGFISHYRADWESWGHWKEWDHNQLKTLLIAACDIVGFDCDDSDLALYYSTVEGLNAWSNCVDWPKFESARIEKRAELLQEWLETDSQAAKNWIANNAESFDLIAPHLATDCDLDGIAYRCTKTPDMFAGV